MIRGFIDQNGPANQPREATQKLLKTGIASSLNAITGMKGGWRELCEHSILPSLQYEWTLAALAQFPRHMQACVLYATDGAKLRAILPMAMKRTGIEHLYYISPHVPVPVDMLYSDPAALELVFRHALRIGRPISISRVLRSSPLVQLVKRYARERKVYAVIKKAAPAMSLNVAGYALPERSQSSARASILAASFGLAGGPNDVIFQYTAPSLSQVMSMYHEALRLDGNDSVIAKTSHLDPYEFLRTQAYHAAQRGEVRFSGIRFAGQLLAVQMYQVRKNVAWLLKASHLGNLRGSALDTLLMTETIRKLKGEEVEQIMLPAAAALPEAMAGEEIRLVDLRIYPHTSRGMTALMIRRMSRRRRDPNDTMNQPPAHKVDDTLQETPPRL